jgi:hypothetical protein
MAHGPVLVLAGKVLEQDQGARMVVPAPSQLQGCGAPHAPMRVLPAKALEHRQGVWVGGPAPSQLSYCHLAHARIRISLRAGREDGK